MDILNLTPGDFLKNAGIVGFLRLWEYVKRKRGDPFELTDKIDVSELLQVDLAQTYIEVFIEYFEANTKTAKAFQRLDQLVQQLEGDMAGVEHKRLQEELKFIQDSLTCDSLKSGFESIRSRIADEDCYENIVKEKLKISGKDEIPLAKQTLLPRLKSLQQFCRQPLVRSTFVFKTICYNVINSFWTNKSFLLRANAKKDMIGLIETDFTKPLSAFLSKKEYKAKSYCISCGLPLAQDKEKTSVAFMVDMADDLSRKTSAFWNFKPDAWLCPVCTFLYALAPLGFCQVDNGDMVFINANDSVQTLWANNHPKIKNGQVVKIISGLPDSPNNQPKLDNDQETLSYHQRIDNAIMQLLANKAKIQNNVQVITRTHDDRYHFNIIDRELIRLTQSKPVQVALQRLVKQSNIKLSNNDYLNVYRLTIENLLNYRNQYNLLSMLIVESLKQPWINVFLRSVLDIQCAQLTEKEDHSMDLGQTQYFAAKAGDELRSRLVADKIGRENIATIAEDNKEDIIRGVVYQLTNALKVQNVEQFTDIIIRLYSSCKLPIPSVFLQALRSEDQFTMIGYAFILGLKGAYFNKDNKKQEGENNNG